MYLVLYSYITIQTEYIIMDTGEVVLVCIIPPTYIDLGVL